MPSVKRTGVKSEEKKTGFESYDGPAPTKRGMYRAVIRQADFKEFKSGAQGFKLLVELQAAKGDPKDHAQYDGFPLWSNLVFGDKEAMITRESNFYAAIGVKDDPAIVFDQGSLTDGVKIKTIGGKNPVGAVINADIKISRQEGYEGDPEVDGLYKIRDDAGAGKKATAPADEDEDLMEEDESSEEEGDSEEGADQTPDERKAELKAASIADLKGLAKEYELSITGLTKVKLVDAIVDYEYSEDNADEEESADEDEELEEDEEESEEEEDGEEEGDDEQAARSTELEALDREALKKIIKGLQPEFKVFKSTTEADLIAAILSEEFGDDETPF